MGSITGCERRSASLVAAIELNPHEGALCVQAPGNPLTVPNKGRTAPIRLLLGQ